MTALGSDASCRRVRTDADFVRRAAHLGVSITEGKEHAEEKFGY